MGRSVLVIEDEFLIALEIESALQAAGIEEVVSAATERAGLREVQRRHWDAVILDANLNGAGIGPIAAALSDQSIPFLIVTGYGRESLPPEVSSIPLLMKPFVEKELVATVFRVMGS